MVKFFQTKTSIFYCLLFLSCFSLSSIRGSAVGAGLVGGALIGSADPKKATLGAALSFLPIFRSLLRKQNDINPREDVQETSFFVSYGMLVGFFFGSVFFPSDKHQTIAKTIAFASSAINILFHYYVLSKFNAFLKMLKPKDIDEDDYFDID